MTRQGGLALSLARLAPVPSTRRGVGELREVSLASMFRSLARSASEGLA